MKYQRGLRALSFDLRDIFLCNTHTQLNRKINEVPMMIARTFI